MFISASLTKFRTNPAGFTARPPAKYSFAMNEPLKEFFFRRFILSKRRLDNRLINNSIPKWLSNLAFREIMMRFRFRKRPIQGYCAVKILLQQAKKQYIFVVYNFSKKYFSFKQMTSKRQSAEPSK